MRRRGWQTAAGLAALSVAWAQPARAAPFFSARGELKPEMHRVLLVHDGARVTLVEESLVRSTAPRTVRLRGFPARPETRAVDGRVLAELDRLSTVPEPYNEVVRRRMFGPSVVTLLTQRLAPRPPAENPWPTAERGLALVDRFLIDAPIPTSTITFRPILPDRLLSTLRVEGVDLGRDTETQLVSLTQRGWVIEVQVLADPRPNQAELARLGPFRTDFDARSPIYPVNMVESVAGQPFRFFVATASASRAQSYELAWDERPWDQGSEAPPRDTLRVSYSRPLRPGDQLHAELTEREEVPLPSAPWFMRADFDPSGRALADFELAPVQPRLLPGPAARGTWIDLAFSTILGLTPLLYAPESWFILWLVARARERARKGERGPGIRLWSFWALLVGAYWFLTLPAGARVAGILPALVGLVQLTTPFLEREAAPIRVQFRKKPAKKK